MKRFRSFLRKPLAAAGVALALTASLQAEPLKIGYSDWPGWVAWEVAIQKGWFKEAAVDVQFDWFEYVPSMEAFAAGKIDAVCMTNGDALVTGATGAPSKWAPPAVESPRSFASWRVWRRSPAATCWWMANRFADRVPTAAWSFRATRCFRGSP
jgi:hypothetical protein